MKSFWETGEWAMVWPSGQPTKEKGKSHLLLDSLRLAAGEVMEHDSEDWALLNKGATVMVVTAPDPQSAGTLLRLREQIATGLTQTILNAGRPIQPVASAKATQLYIEALGSLMLKVEAIEKTLGVILEKLESLRTGGRAVWVPIETLAPEPYDLLRPIAVVVTPSNEGFEAAFFDAQIYAGGETEEDALTNLKSCLLDTFDRLNQLGDSELGPGLLKQKQILSWYLRKR
jgi:hypothetical protein